MKEAVKKLLDELNVEYRWIDHPPVFTVAESFKVSEYRNPIKNILLQEKGDGRRFLVVIAGQERLNVNAIREKFGTKRLQFAPDQVLEETFGVKPGAVSIFGLLHSGATGVCVVIDEKVLQNDEIGFHPNDNTATVLFSTDNLESILQRIGRDHTIMKLY